jgi:hypothetical protein
MIDGNRAPTRNKESNLLNEEKDCPCATNMALNFDALYSAEKLFLSLELI